MSLKLNVIFHAKYFINVRTNMIALVSGGSRPMFSENTVMIYDDKKNKFVLEFTLPSPVLGVRLKRNKLVAICR